MQPSPSTLPASPTSTAKAATSRAEPPADQGDEPFGAVISRVASQGHARPAHAAQGKGPAKDAQDCARAAPEAADETSAPAQGDIEAAAADTQAPTDDATSSVQVLLAVVHAAAAVPVTPAAPEAVVPAIVTPAFSSGAGDDDPAPATDSKAEAADEPTGGEYAASRPAQRGPGARAFAQANAHAQPALAAAAANHAEGTANARESFELPQASSDAIVRQQEVAAPAAARSETLLSMPVPTAFGATSPAPGHAAPVSARVEVPLSHPRFADDFGDRLVWMAKGQVSSAEIAITPADLGPVRISIELRGSDATIHFGAAAPATRVAIEDALPRLKELLSQQGLNLADAHVGSETARDQRPPSQGPVARHDRLRFESEPAAGHAQPAPTARSLRLIDVVA